MHEEIQIRDSTYPYTRSIKAAAAMVTIGARLRDSMAITAVQREGRDQDLIFWFEPGEITVGSTKATVQQWLSWFLGPWEKYPMAADHEHPMTYLKSMSQNRDTLVGAAKKAAEKPFRVLQRGRRLIVVGANIPEEKIVRALAQL